MPEISNISYLKFLKNSGINTFLQNKVNNFYNSHKNKKIPIISNNIGDVKDYNELEIFISNSHINNIQKYSNKIIFGNGNIKSNIIIIGEGPSAEDENIGKPIAGRSGQLLNKMFKAINIDMKDVFVANIIPWRLLENRNPTNEEIIECLPFIQRLIELIKPDFLLLLGSTATKAILGTNLNFSNLRKEWHYYNSVNLNKKIECLVSYDPLHLLKNPKDKKMSWEDLKIFKKKITNEKI